MSTLHLVRQSAFSTTDFQQCLDIVASNDTIIFMDDGCYCLSHSLINHSALSVNVGVSLYVLAEHVDARAITTSKQIKKIAMSDVVKFTFEMDNVITWQ